MGDFEYKTAIENGQVVRKQFITCVPEVRMAEIDPEIDEFIVMGSDCLFDKMSSRTVINYAKSKLKLMPYME